jgi:DNA-binding transcriptional ArsR family regulator
MSTHEPTSRDRSHRGPLSKDAIFSILSNQRRRYVIYHLAQSPDPVSLRDLAERVAAWENDVDVEDLTYKQRKRVYTSLHQTHLPKLDDSGVVDYDRDRGTVSLDERAADLDVYLEVVGDDDLPWCDFYLGLSGVVLLVVVAAWLDVFPFSVVPDLAVAGGIVALFAVSAAVHARLARRDRIGANAGVQTTEED